MLNPLKSASMKVNIIHDIQRSDSTSGGGTGTNAMGVESYTAIGGETQITIPELIGKQPQFMFVDGVYFSLAPTDPPQGKKYTFDTNTGTITLSAQTPALDPGVVVTVHYVDTSAIVDDIEPVTLQQVKDFCGIDFTEWDDMLNVVRTAARIQCEQYTGVSFIPKNITAVLSNSAGYIELPEGPVTGTPVVTDSEGTAVMSATFQGNEFKRLAYPYDSNLTVEYTAGYQVLPAHFKMAILNQCKYLFDNRGVGEAGLSPLALMTLKHFRRVP